MSSKKTRFKRSTDEFHKYQKIRKMIGSKALPIAIGASIVFAICLFGLIPGVTFANLFKVDVVLSVGLVTVVTWVVSFVERLINKRIEEKIKLNGNYDENIKRYPKEDAFERNGKKYPVVEICPKISKLTAEINDVPTFTLDSITIKYLDELMSAHKTSRFKNKPIYRLDSYSYQNEELKVTLSLSDSYKTLLTNRVMDFEIHDHITVREVFEPGPSLTPIEHSKLCNGFGFNFITRTTDGYYLLVKHTDKNPTNKFKYCTFSSQLNTHFNDEDKTYEGRLRQLSYNAMITNLNYLKSKSKSIYECVKIEDVEYLGLVRNLIEGGKPELCYVLNIHLSKNEAIAQFNAATPETKKERGVDRIIAFKPDGFEIKEGDKVDFKGIENNATVTLVGMYILEKLKDTLS